MANADITDYKDRHFDSGFLLAISALIYSTERMLYLVYKT